MPCCVIGALFALQLMAVVKWFKRVVLRQEPVEEDENLWVPQRAKLKDKLKRIFSDPKRRKIIIGIVCAEVVLVVTVWLLGGFDVIGRFLFAISEKPEASLANTVDCCTKGN